MHRFSFPSMEAIFGSFVLLFAFALPLSRAVNTFFVVLFALYFLYVAIRQEEERKALFKLPAATAILLLIFYLTLSLVWSEDLSNGFKYLRLYYWEWLAIFGLALYLRHHPEKIHAAVTAFMIGMLVSEILSYGMYFELWQVRGHGREYPSPFMMHIDYSIFLAMAAAILINRLFSNRYDRKEKLIMLIFFFTIVGNLFINLGRTGQLAFLVVMFVAFFLHYRPSLANFLKATIVTALLFGGAYLLSDRFHQRVAAAFSDFTQLSKGAYDSSIGLRIAQYIVGKDVIAANPLIGTGIGGRNANVAEALQEHAYGFSPFVKEFLATHHSHNQYLQLFIESGLVGLILMLILLCQLFKLDLHDDEFNELKTLLLTVYTVGFLTEPLWQKQFTNTLYILFAGLFLGKALADKNKEAKEVS